MVRLAVIVLAIFTLCGINVITPLAIVSLIYVGLEIFAEALKRRIELLKI